MYPCRLCVPTAARCHCFRLPNNSLVLKGVGDGTVLIHGGPQSVSLVPQVPYLAPSGRVVPPRRAYTIPPPIRLTTTGAGSIQGCTRNSSGGRRQGTGGRLRCRSVGRSHTRTVFVCLSVCLSVSSESLPQEVTGLCCWSSPCPACLCMECCRESLEPASMRPFHNNIAQNYRVEGASPLWVENRQLV